MKLSTKGMMGKTGKSISVTTNDPNQPTFKLTMTGVVNQFAIITPQRVLLRGLPGEKITQVVTVRSGTGESFAIVETSAMKGEDFRYSMTEIEVEGKPAFQFLIENTRMLPGRYLDQVTILTDKPEHNPIFIPISGDIKPLGAVGRPPLSQGQGMMK